MNQLDSSSILITEGTGSLSKSMITHILDRTSAIRLALFPESGSFYSKEISLPIHANFTEYQIDRVIELSKKFIN